MTDAHIHRDLDKMTTAALFAAMVKILGRDEIARPSYLTS